MCVIVIGMPGRRPTAESLDLAAGFNPDGFGFAHAKINGNELSYFRTLEFDRFMEEFSKIPSNHVVLIHFRFATHGPNIVENCHPFPLESCVMAHNGVVINSPAKLKLQGFESDSRAFLRVVLKPMEEVDPYVFHLDPSNRRKIMEMAGAGNKFAFLDILGRVTILGPDWKAFERCFWSNLDFLSG